MICICGWLCCFFFKQNTAYEMRISDWSSDVCSSDLSMAPASAPLGLPPPPGFMQFQKKVWFHTWAAWLNRVPELDLMISSSDLLALSVPAISSLVLLT